MKPSPIPIVVVAEGSSGRVHQASLEVMSAASRLAAATGTRLRVVLVGEAGPALIGQLGDHGASRVTIVAGRDASDPAAAAVAIASAVSGDPAMILCAGTVTGGEIAPRLAVILDAALISDCTYMRAGAAGGLPELTVQSADGSGAVRMTWEGTVVVVVPPGVFRAEPRKVDGPPAIDEIATEAANGSGLETIGAHPIDPAIIPIDESAVLVSGGLGMGGTDGFAMLSELAEAIGGRVAASRRATDLGWAPTNVLVGQTGKRVAPDLYIACGISGASQHVLGMVDSGFVVSINTDPNAPIHAIADVAVIADAGTLVPLLTDRFSERREAKA